MFAIGEKVICIDASGGLNLPPLTKGLEYIIKAIHELRCGCVLCDVGLISNYIEIRCPHDNVAPNNDIHWASSQRFAPIQDNFAENALSKALKEGKELHERIYV